MGIHIRMAESLHCSPETVTTLFVNQLYPNTKFKNNFFFKEKKTRLKRGKSKIPLTLNH